MKKIIGLICLISYISFFSPCFASVEVPTNTSIFIIPKETITSKDMNLGEIQAEINEDVVINKVTVFKSGARAVLKISEIEKARCWGNPGKLVINNGFVYDEKGIKHKITFNKSFYGKEKTWPKTCGVVSLFFLWPLALFGFVHGGQAVVSSTNEIEAYLSSGFNF